MTFKRCFGYQSKSQYRIWQRALAKDPSWPLLNKTSYSDMPGCGRGVSYSNPVFESNEEQLWTQCNIQVNKTWKRWQRAVSVIFKQWDSSKISWSFWNQKPTQSWWQTENLIKYVLQNKTLPEKSAFLLASENIDGVSESRMGPRTAIDQEIGKLMDKENI